MHRSSTFLHFFTFVPAAPSAKGTTWGEALLLAGGFVEDGSVLVRSSLGTSEPRFASVMESHISQKRVRVVVVDDSHDFRNLVISIVHSHPELQLVGEAWDGQEAVAKIETLSPHLILLDLGLPSLNGLEVARAILKTSPNRKIIIVSQESSPDIMDEAFCIGAHGYVLKSDVWVLGEAVRAVLDGRQFISKTIERDRSH